MCGNIIWNQAIQQFWEDFSVQYQVIPKIIDCSHVTFVSEGIGDSFKDWRRYNPVFIDAPTGSGKNTFILNELVPYAKSRGKYVLLLGNRTALNLQQKRILYRKISPNNVPDSRLHEMNIFENVITISYQGFINWIENTTSEFFSQIEFVVFDEAHFFLSDARFNANTRKIFEVALRIFFGQIRIYMSATLQPVLEPLLIKETDLVQLLVNPNTNIYDYKVAFELSAHKEPVVAQYYKFNQDYTNCNFRFFHHWESVVSQISQSSSDEKWLIFVKAKQDRKGLEDQLKARGVPSNAIAYLDANEKDGKCYKRIINYGNFKERVLITTSVIDNGVTIKDTALKHIVVHSLDAVSTIQMIGRKRKDVDETTNYYFKIPTQAEVTQSIKQIDRLLEFIESYKTPTFIERFRHQWGTLSEEKQKLFRIVYSNPYQQQKQSFGFNIELELNEFAHMKLVYDKGNLEEMDSKMDYDPSAGVQEIILSWFGDPVVFSEEMMLEMNPVFREQQIASITVWLDKMVTKGPLESKEILQAETDLSVMYEDILHRKMSVSTESQKTNRVKANIDTALGELEVSNMYQLDKLSKAQNKEQSLSNGASYWRFKKK